MEIILLESLNKLGKAGEVVNVRDGFARNFLIPQKKAIIANKKNKADLDHKMSLITKNNEIKITEAKDLRSKIDGKSIQIEMESNDEGSLYGSITQKLIIENIEKYLSVKLSTDCVILTPIKNIGTHEIKLRLYDDIQAIIELKVIKKT